MHIALNFFHRYFGPQFPSHAHIFFACVCGKQVHMYLLVWHGHTLRLEEEGPGNSRVVEMEFNYCKARILITRKKIH